MSKNGKLSRNKWKISFLSLIVELLKTKMYKQLKFIILLNAQGLRNFQKKKFQELYIDLLEMFFLIETNENVLFSAESKLKKNPTKLLQLIFCLLTNL